MSRMQFDANLEYQLTAVRSVMRLFDGELEQQLQMVQRDRGIKPTKLHAKYPNVFDIRMQTGTGKTYTFLRTMLQMANSEAARGGDERLYFVILVPTLAIKAGTKATIEATREHFMQLALAAEFSAKEFCLYELNASKSSARVMPQAIKQFVEHSNDAQIPVLLLNMGMLNSASMKREYDRNLFGAFNAAGAIASRRVVMIIDEPHRFSESTKSWEQIQALAPRMILRYGATFSKMYNHIYELGALQAFKAGLVKGVRAWTQDVALGQNSFIELVRTENKTAVFRTFDGKMLSLGAGESFAAAEEFLRELRVDAVGAKGVLLSNGQEIALKEKFNPYNYRNDLAMAMVDECLKEHFELERALMDVNGSMIKPICLFFIDEISSYRGGGEGEWLREYIERRAGEIMSEMLAAGRFNTAYYEYFLRRSVAEISKIHGGYFSADNDSKSDEVQEQMCEILHDKAKLLDVENPRRFIVSKWTLKEGWDNPNVFSICKLRGSGSEVSKLQEVGRGLRLPVDEHGCRIQGRQFWLNYFVDASEKDFVEQLREEIMQRAPLLQKGDEIDFGLLCSAAAAKNLSSEQLLDDLRSAGAVDERGRVLDASALAAIAPELASSEQIAREAVVNARECELPGALKMRSRVFASIAEIWEILNTPAVLLYSCSDDDFAHLWANFIVRIFDADSGAKLVKNESYIGRQQLCAEGDEAYFSDALFSGRRQLAGMNYAAFVAALARQVGVRRECIHKGFCQAAKRLDAACGGDGSGREGSARVRLFVHAANIKPLAARFNEYLLYAADNPDLALRSEYIFTRARVHPTRFTDEHGAMLESVSPAYFGRKRLDAQPDERYLFDGFYFDSNIERETLGAALNERVQAYSKLPSCSLRIAVPGGWTYTPDFIYVIGLERGGVGYLLVESKGVKSDFAMREAESARIKQAKMFTQQLARVKLGAGGGGSGGGGAGGAGGGAGGFGAGGAGGFGGGGKKLVLRTQLDGQSINEIIREEANT